MKKCVISLQNGEVHISPNLSDATIGVRFSKDTFRKLDHMARQLEGSLKKNVNKFIEERFSSVIEKNAVSAESFADGQWHEVAVGAGKTEIKYGYVGRTNEKAWHIRRTTGGGEVSEGTVASLYAVKNSEFNTHQAFDLEAYIRATAMYYILRELCEKAEGRRHEV